MKPLFSAFFCFWLSWTPAQSATVNLATAGSFAVLGGSAITNTGPSVIGGGHVGVMPGTAVTGFPPGTIAPPYALHAADAVAQQAQSDLTAAFVAGSGLAPTANLTGQDLGGKTLVPGVYFFSTSAQLTGALTLDFQGDPDAQFVFQIGSTLTTASNSAVFSQFAAASGCNVFWILGSSATLGTNSSFLGHILALTSITLNTGAALDGSALARNGAVTLDNNRITNLDCFIPEPSAGGIALLGAVLLASSRRRSGKTS